MFDKFKDGDLVTSKFVSGEEVIATFKGSTNDTISITKGLVLMQGPQGLAFGTFFSTADQTKHIDIAKDKIMTMAYINDKIKVEYERVFSKIEVPAKPTIIT